MAIDTNYVSNRKEELEDSKWLCFRGTNDLYVMNYAKVGFYQGATVGFLFGLYKSTKNMSVVTIPKFALAGGLLWGGFHAYTALFRNQI